MRGEHHIEDLTECDRPRYNTRNIRFDANIYLHRHSGGVGEDEHGSCVSRHG
jgi:hypothetical protein